VKNFNLVEVFLSSLKSIVIEDPYSKSYLLGVSGGSDSMCLANLFLVSGLNFSVAHVNYSLRGAESIDDMNFVISWANKNNIPCYTKVINLQTFLESNGGNLQDIARNIRYNFFEEIRLNNAIDFVCTAHHASDWLETLIFNFFRGGLLNALVGISVRNGVVIRPLLNLDKSIISSYITQNKISFKSDSSNEKLIYKRNLIRHKVLPLVNKINSSILTTFQNNRRIWMEIVLIKNTFIKKESPKIVTNISENEFLLSLEGLNNSIAPITLLYEILNPLGFSSKLIFEINKRRSPTTLIGTVLIHENWKMVKLENYFRFIKKSLFSIQPVLIEIDGEGEYFINSNRKLIVKNSGFLPENLNQGVNKIIVDAEKIIYPLLLRKWEPGDFFFPINMNNHKKKVKDFLTDKKLDKLKKQDVFILENADGQIIWIVGLRQDNRFKIEPLTKHILIFEYKID